MRLLAQCAANSSSERNWSTYKFVHSTVRNWLLCDRAEKLAYMYCNERILNCIESDDYEENMPVWMYDCATENDGEYGEKDADDNALCTDDFEDMATEFEMEYNLEVDAEEIEVRLQHRLGHIEANHVFDNENVTD